MEVLTRIRPTNTIKEYRVEFEALSNRLLMALPKSMNNEYAHNIRTASKNVIHCPIEVG